MTFSVKQPLTLERAARIKESLTVMCLMANVMKMEYMSDMDVNFKNPMINQFNGRIIKDIDAILFHIKNYKTNVDVIDKDLLENYAGEFYRIIHYFMKLPLDQIKEVMDNLETIAKGVEV